MSRFATNPRFATNSVAALLAVLMMSASFATITYVPPANAVGASTAALPTLA